MSTMGATRHLERRSGALMLLGVERERDSQGRPLETFCVTMASSKPGAGLQITAMGVAEDELGDFLDASVADAELHLFINTER